MTINVSTRFTRHAWAMPAVPGLPSGVWTASHGSEGDASGGTLTFQHIFRNNSNNLGDTNLYNIEHVMVASANAANTGCRLLINGMDPGTGQIATPLPLDRAYAFDLVDTDVVGGLVRAIAPEKGTKPIWVGTYSGPDTDLGDMIISLVNPTGSFLVHVVVYGYYWAPSAVNAPGGIRRPEGGIWGN